MPQPKPNEDAALHILIVDQNVMRASILEDGLRDAGYSRVTVLRDMQMLMRRIVEIDPDVIFIDLENPNRDVLEQMFQVSRCVHRPIAMFVDRSDTDMIEAAVEAGVGRMSSMVCARSASRPSSTWPSAASTHSPNCAMSLTRARAALDERKLVDAPRAF